MTDMNNGWHMVAPEDRVSFEEAGYPFGSGRIHNEH